jgi:hypothetical protein
MANGKFTVGLARPHGVNDTVVDDLRISRPIGVERLAGKCGFRCPLFLVGEALGSHVLFPSHIGYSLVVINYAL